MGSSQRQNAWRVWMGITALMLMMCGCSLRAIAVNELSDAVSSLGSVWSSDDDPDLVGDALPFSLKLLESLLAENPRHAGLLLALARGFTQYSFGWVQAAASENEVSDPAWAMQQEDRARRLCLRARNYGLRGLELMYPGFENGMRENPGETVRKLARDDVPLLYWTASSWALAISLSKDRPEVVADLPIVEALIDRALELDETFDRGAIHGFLITYELNRPGGAGDPLDRARKHFERARELSGGTLAAPFVTFAENVSVQMQNRKEFDSLLQQALAIDPDAHPESRLENLISQRHARWLLDHADELFLGEPEDVANEPSP